MFHMLFCFNLKPGETIGAYEESYQTFFEDMRKLDLVETTGPIGRRQNDTPMDTDEERNHEYFVIMSFRDRPQVDDAYAYIMRHVDPGDSSHNSMYAKVANPVFICWQDIAQP